MPRPSIVVSLIAPKRLLGLVLLPQLLDLRALLLDLLLLLLDLRLGLLICDFLVLHGVADRVAGHASHARTDRGARAWMPHRSTNDRAGAGAETCATESALFTCGKRLPGTSRDNHCCDKRQSRNNRDVFTHRRPPHLKIRRGGLCGFDYSVSCCCLSC